MSAATETRTADPWAIDAGGYPGNGPIEARLRFIAAYAHLAPSGHNTQPWLFHIDGDALTIYADRGRALAVVDPDDRELVMSCGAAVLNARVAIRRFGHEPDVAVLPDPGDPDAIATLRLGATRLATPSDLTLFDAVTRRRTNRDAFDARAVADSLVATLVDAAAAEGAWLAPVNDGVARQELADLIVEADEIQFDDKRFRRELSAWLHPRRRGDGIPMGDLEAPIAQFVVRRFDLGRGRAAKDRDLVDGSPRLVVLGTDGDGERDWINAGQAMERVLLTARAAGVWASFLNQPIEVAELRPRVAEAIGRTGHAQLIMRLGYGHDVQASPRRALEYVML